jgi:4-amino-4-deoxy-L-arabinose transferase-like glycosyltransferase
MASEEEIRRRNGGRLAAESNGHGGANASWFAAVELGLGGEDSFWDEGGRPAVPRSALGPPPATPLSDGHATRTRFELHGPLGQGGREDPTPVMGGSAFVAAPRLREPGYSLRPVPQLGWTAAPSRRRTRVSRAILLGILVVQALLSLRLRNTAFQDEALYLYIGNLELDHFLSGTPVPPGFTAYFSGSPVLYPVLAAAVESVFGLAGARALSLVFMLGATALLYSLTRLLFNERAALCAAAIFATTQSTLLLGNFATYDAAAIFLLALAAWIVVRTAPSSAILACILAAPVAALAVAVKYATLMFLPTVVMLAALAAFPHRRWGGLVLRGILLPAVTAAILTGALALAGDDYLQAVRVTTTARAVGNAKPLDLFLDCLQWGGGFLALALLGAVAYAWQERMDEVPRVKRDGGRSRPWRLALGLLLCGTALLAPAYQMHLHTSVSLHKHIGYGLLFTAPMAGVGLSRMVGAHFRYPQLAILAWVTLLALGITQSQDLYHAWADSTRMVATLKSQLKPGGRYLVESSSVPQYYLRAETTSDQWTSTYAITYVDRKGRRLSGEAGYRAALGAAYFDVIVLDRTVTKEFDDKLLRQLRTNGKYRLLAKLPYRNSYGSGSYQVWVKR